MWLLSALESTGFTWVASPAFSSVSSSSPSPEKKKWRIKKARKKIPNCTALEYFQRGQYPCYSLSSLTTDSMS